MDTAEKSDRGNQAPEKARGKRVQGLISKQALYRTVALHADCSVGFVSNVDHGFRSNGERTRRVLVALKAAYEVANTIEPAIMASLK